MTSSSGSQAKAVAEIAARHGDVGAEHGRQFAVEAGVYSHRSQARR